MKTIFISLSCLAIVGSCCSCRQREAQTENPSEPIILYRDKPNQTLTDIAYDLLKFEKYEMALELVDGDTSRAANNIRARVHEARKEYREAIRIDIINLRIYDTDEFFESNWVLDYMYELCKHDIDYAISLLETERKRCPRNYQVRLLLMKLHWFAENLEAVIEIGNELHMELPDMSSDVSFNYWRQDALDSLKIKDRKSYGEIVMAVRI